MKNLAGKVAAITGAASGIGRSTAQALAKEGCALALADIDESGLSETARLLGNTSVSQHIVDVADYDSVAAFARAAEAQHGRVDIIVNNAGVVLIDHAHAMTMDDLDWVMGVNFRGVVHGVKAFLPAMLARDEGHIVNVSSIMGLYSMPSQAAYCASKHAVRGYSESLRLELMGSGVGVSVVYPGVISTNVMANSRYAMEAAGAPGKAEMVAGFKKAALTSPERAARRIVRAIKKNKARVLVGPDAWISVGMARLMPVRFVNAFGRLTAYFMAR